MYVDELDIEPRHYHGCACEMCIQDDIATLPDTVNYRWDRHCGSCGKFVPKSAFSYGTDVNREASDSVWEMHCPSCGISDGNW